MQVRIFSRARREIGAVVAWWRVNRPAAQGKFEAELGAALLRLATDPYSAPRARDPRLKQFRRLSLLETRYHLYYRVNEAKQQIEVLRVWHMSRRRPTP